MADTPDHPQPAPCPFCSARAYARKLERTAGRDLYAVICGGCGCRTQYRATRRRALADWNARAGAAQ